MKTELLTKKEQEILNKFGLAELTASHTYLHLANRAKTYSYFGAEKFFKSESSDEVTHYQGLSDFMNDMGCELSVEALPIVKTDCQDLMSMLEYAFNMEKDLMNAYEQAVESDSVTTKTSVFLQDYLKIQIKAVGEYGDLIARLKLTDDDILVDQELGK